MNVRKYLIYPCGIMAILLSASPVLMLKTGSIWSPVSASGIAASFILYLEIQKLILKEGRTEGRKMMEALMATLIPLLSVSTASLVSQVTQITGLFAVVSVSATMLFRSEINSRLSKNYSLRLGKRAWMGVITAGILLTFYGRYFLFYAILLTGLTALADLVDLSWRIKRD